MYLLKLKEKIEKSTKNYEIAIFIISIIFFIIGNYLTFLVSNIDNLSGIFKEFAILIKSCIFNGRLMTGFMYIAVGMLLSKYKINIKKTYIILGILFSFLLSFYSNCLIIKVVLYILLFIFILSIDLKDNKIYKSLRKMSTVMYFTHMIFFFIYNILTRKLNNFGIGGFSFTLVCSMIFSIIVVKNKDNKLIKLIFL